MFHLSYGIARLLILALLHSAVLEAFNCPNAPAIRLPTDAQALTTAYDCVNLVSGDYYISDTVFSIDGPVPLQYGLVYDAGHLNYNTLACGWHTILPLRFGYLTQYEKKKFWVVGEEIEDSNIPYESVGGPSKTHLNFKIHSNLYSIGYCNTTSAGISGQNNLKNNKALYRNWGHNYESGAFEVQLGSGAKRVYELYKFEDRRQWRLHSETRSNGHRVAYHYYKEHHPSQLFVTNPSGTLTFHSMALAYDKHGLTVRGSNGRSIRYNMEWVSPQRKNKYGQTETANLRHMFEIVPSDGPKSKFFQSKNPDDGLWLQTTHREWSDGRFINIVHDHKSGKVTALTAPLGTDHTAVTLATFVYGKEVTSIYDALQNALVYRFSPEGRTIAIEKYHRDGAQHILYSTRRFAWGLSSPYEGNLMATAQVDSAGLAHTATRYSYDERGNILKQEDFGNFTGEAQGSFSVGANCHPTSSTEVETTLYTYSNDGFNLRLSETHSNGLLVTYQYLPGTNLLTSVLKADKTRIFSREFHTYDDNALLVETLVDDGSSSTKDDLAGVTVRKITRVVPKLTAPACGFPESVSESYLDRSGQEILLKRIVYIYDEHNLVIQEDIYDATDTLCYSLTYAYDDRGNLVAKSDALGRITMMRYDEGKNKIYEALVGSGYRTEYAYDFSQRLIKAEELHDDGVRLVASFRYDYLNRKVASVDPFGHETRHTYDSLGREIETTYPPHITPQGILAVSTVKKEYNVLDQLIAVTDQNGQTTRTSYNVRGQPTLITHPDGTKERFVYNLNGTLAKKWEINGLCHHYTYDVLGRLLRTDSYDASGTLQATQCHEYAGANLIRVTNALGVITEYTYDGAGRKTSETCDTPDAFNKTQITYDSLGRVATTTRWHSRDPQDSITQTQDYDILNRPVGQQVEDAYGTLLSKELYDYDIRGNRILTRVFHSPTESSDAQIDYDSRNLPIRLIDDLGHVTHISYNYRHRNSAGQTVLCKITTDPLGRTTTVTQDALGRIQESTTVDPLGNILSRHHLWQDAVGNLIRRTDDIIANGKVLRRMITEWSYDSRNRPLQLIEAVSTSEERLTTRSYNPFGQLEAIHLADGITLSHAYDPMGRLSHYYASDNSFSYRYQYDPLGNVLSIEDTLTNTHTLRQYDSLQRITQETLGNGLTLDYQYDAFNRPTRLTLPDSSAIGYTYNATNLSEVQRLNPDNTIRYTHRTLLHNLRGKPLEAQLIGKQEGLLTYTLLTYTYDRLGRPQSLTSPYHSDTVPEDGYDAGGNLLKRQGFDAFIQPCNQKSPPTWFSWFWGTKEEPQVQPQQVPWEWNYHYDALDQLISEKGATSHQYQNDSLNNRLSKDGAEYELNHLNMLVKTDDTLYLYDRRGNLIESQTSGQKTSYRYDALGRLLELETPTSLQLYRYDSFNRRLSQTSYTKQTEWVEAETQNTLYAGQNDIGAFDSSHQLIRLRLLGEGRGAEIGAAVAIELKDTLYTPLHDLCGNVIALIDSEGSIAESYRYSAFGEEQIFSPYGAALTRSAIGNPWRYSSKTTDDTGFVYFGRRYFIPSTGRWLTPDPIGYEAGPNLYAYVHNNPLTHVDLYGLYAQQPENRHHIRHSGAREASFGESAYNGFKYAASLPGQGLEFVGRHILPPIESVRQFTMGFGRVGSFRPAEGCSVCREVPSHEYSIYGYREYPNVRFSVTNGILNTPSMGKQFGQCVSDAFGGITVNGLYNRTHGFCGDLVKNFALSSFGAITRAARELAKTWTRLYHEMDGDVRRIIHIAHSQGAAVAWAASKLISGDVAKAINYIGFGGSKMIPDGTFGNVRNIVCHNDYVSKTADPVGHLAALTGAGVHVEYIRGQGILEHRWDGAYKQAMEDIGLDFQDNNKSRFYGQ